MPTHLYLSPHFDDSALSCGGLIHRQTRAGERVIVATICAGAPPEAAPLSPFAEALHARWGTPPGQAVASRRAEDLAALARLGAEAVHLDLLDCIYRPAPDQAGYLYASEAALFGARHPAEAPLIDRLAAQLHALITAEAVSHLYVQLAIGRHVDHQLVREAAERLNAPRHYVEDYPYADRVADAEAWGGLARGLTPHWEAFAEADLAAWGEAVGEYHSQVGSFWPDEAAMRQALRRFATRGSAQTLGTRLWRAKKVRNP